MVIEAFPLFEEGATLMFGVTFDLDIHQLEDSYGIPRQKAYAEIERRLAAIGYKHVLYSVYVCPEPEHSELLVVHETIDALKALDWFAPCMKQVIAFEISRWGNITDVFRS